MLCIWQASNLLMYIGQHGVLWGVCPCVSAQAVLKKEQLQQVAMQ